MDKNKINSNDVLEALSLRVNEVLRPGKKKEGKKDNIFFWIFKGIFLVLYIILLAWFFEQLKGLGAAIIYLVAKSLRSVLSGIWIVVIDFIKELIILFLLYDHLKIFTSSTYYENLYAKEKVLCKRKKAIFKGIDIFLKVLSVCFLVVSGFFAAISIFFAIYLIIMFMDGVFVISPIIIMLSIFAICYFTFKHVQNKFFNGKAVITKNYFLASFIALLLGVIFFGYEVSSFEYNNTLPIGFDIVKKEQVFDVSEYNSIILKSDSKLDNLKVIIDDELGEEIKVEFEYFETANVKYVYYLTDDGSLKLKFTSSLEFESENVVDVLKLFMASFNNKTIYNYNLFKYPNIYVHANKDVLERISIQ